MSNVPREFHQEFVGYVGSRGVNIDSTRLTANLQPNHGQEPLMSVGHMVSKDAGRGTIPILVPLLQSNS